MEWFCPRVQSSYNIYSKTDYHPTGKQYPFIFSSSQLGFTQVKETRFIYCCEYSDHKVIIADVYLKWSLPMN